MKSDSGAGQAKEQFPPVYLNTDLELEWCGDFKPLVNALAGQTYVLYNGPAGERNRLTLELEETPAEASEAISVFCGLIENLPPEAKAVWNAADSRVFDIGYESGIGEQLAKMVIEPDVLNRVAQLGVSVVVTIYPITLNKEGA